MAEPQGSPPNPFPAPKKSPKGNSQPPYPSPTGQLTLCPSKLDEQHQLITQTLGFLIHPTIPLTSPALKIADIGTGTGIFLLDLARHLPPSCHLTGFDISSSAFPASQSLPQNVTFKTQDMLLPFPASEIGTYDIVAVRFVSVATTRSDWAKAVQNLMTLLKPGGWLQWIVSCNFALYHPLPGTSSAACEEIFEGLEPLRAKKDVVVGMVMRGRDERRKEVWRGVGMVDVR